MIDNYDSFTFNLVHYFQALGQEVLVVRNDEISIDEITELAPQYIVISPGPCDPDAAGLSLEIIEKFKGHYSYFRCLPWSSMHCTTFWC